MTDFCHLRAGNKEGCNTSLKIGPFLHYIAEFRYAESYYLTSKVSTVIELIRFWVSQKICNKKTKNLKGGLEVIFNSSISY